MTWKIITGNNTDVLHTYEDNTFDSIVTDPPYGIAFLGKDWDNDTGALETWQECFRVLKPGGHLLAFSAARTYHHLATNIEQSGFEIRDQLMWLYGYGFPKAQDIGKAIQKRQGVEKSKPQKGLNAFNNKGKTAPKVAYDGEDAEYSNKKDEIIPTSIEAQAWSGWKTALKPAHEPIVMARKPFKGSCIDNVLEHGVGALNIDASRVPYNNEQPVTTHSKKAHKGQSMAGEFGSLETHSAPGQEQGRFPSNVLGEVEGYQKFFYCPKVSRAERHAGFENLPKRLCGPGGDGWVQAQEHQGNNKKDNLDHIPKYDRRTEGLESAGFQGLQKLDGKKGNLDHIPAPFGDVKGCYVDGKRFAAKHQELQTNKRPRGEAFGDGNLLKDATQSVGNNHPTVKPVELMKYLVRLVTPKGGKVLDPFNGSGSTGMACVELGYDYTGIDLDKDYVEIANKRISAWEKKFDTPANNLFEEN